MDTAKAAHLNPQYTFENLFDAECNHDAIMLCKAAALRPHQSYNPLLIQGGTGTGKTHLLHAIGNEVRTNRPELVVCYRTTEDFTNGYVKHARADEISKFRRGVKKIGMLLLDDIPFVENKGATQQELIFVFDLLRDSDKQIIVSSSVDLSHILGIGEPLRRRFSSGMTVTLRFPDHVAKLSAAKKIASKPGFSPEIIEYVARTASTFSQIRAMLSKLEVHCAAQNVDCSLPVAEQLLREFASRKEPQIALTDIERVVRQRLQQWKGGRIGTLFASKIFPNQVITYIARKGFNLSYPSIGKLVEKHHTTVMHSVEKIELMRKRDNEVHRFLTSVEAALSCSSEGHQQKSSNS